MKKADVMFRQNGSVLLISLIFLLVLSLFGVSSMESTGLSEKMVGSMRDRQAAFQAAEAALLEGENFLATTAQLSQFDGSNNGLYPISISGNEAWRTINWTVSGAVRAYQGKGFTELASPPVYIIEVAAIESGDDSLGLGGETGDENFFRVTSRAVGLTANSEVILQSVYKQ